ncbi:hypothetical protein [Chryseobacterium sp. ERMR1:04]|uniref:hypothetical protein n=1 Tax=Chryseobacterium sp. ERMR1:04 TaxID=1705393 RepID=UPI0006C890F2|nr:hypothetical protein [Chryseobacterium sp. ERMR1:04]KPH14768.1 hypothetical protein AMQ68_04795 [Chryseobacterium sp. ERMR1:04]
MKKILILAKLFIALLSFAQIGIGRANPRGALDINKDNDTNTMGLVLPTNSNVNNIINPLGSNVIPGTIIYDSTNDCVRLYKGTNAWSNCLSDTSCEGMIQTLDCAGATHTGTLTNGQAATGVSSVISYTGGNGSAHSGQTVASTGVTGLTATLSAGSFATGNGTLTYTISGTPSGSGTASFAINIGGQTCTLTRTVQNLTASVGSLTCASATFSPATITAGNAYTGTMTVPYTGGNGGSYPQGTAQVINGLTFRLQAGTLNIGSGNLVYTVTGTPTSVTTMSIPVSFSGATTCNVSKAVQLPATPPAKTGCFNIIYNSNSSTGFITQVTNSVAGNVSQRTSIPDISWCQTNVASKFNHMSIGTTTTWKFNKPVGFLGMTIDANGSTTNTTPTFWRNGVQVYPSQTHVGAFKCDTNIFTRNFEYEGVWFDEMRYTADRISITEICLDRVSKW